jgi:hypothetical protein
LTIDLLGRDDFEATKKLSLSVVALDPEKSTALLIDPKTRNSVLR